MKMRITGWVVTPAVVLCLGASTFAAVFWRTGGYLVRNDGTAYFMYARSVVVDFDTDLTNEFEDLDSRLPADSEVMMAVRDSELRAPSTGRVVMPWPMGSGLVMAPFYALGYGLERAVAALTGRPADSYGVIAQAFFGLGSLVYGLLGFLATAACCRRVAASWASWLSMAAVVLGGPVVFYVFFHPSMSHASSFGLVSLLVLLWWRRWDGEGHGTAVLGLLLGLLVIVRYQNAVYGILLVALLVRMARRGSLPSALRAGVAAGLACLAPLTLQLVHLVLTWGSLGKALEGATDGGSSLAQNAMDPASPHFFDVLVSCQHGVFYWAPIWGLAFAALLWAAWRSGWARVFALVFLANVYLVGCLQGLAGTNWSGAHAFGMRYLSECAPLLAAGLATLIARFPRPVARSAWAALLGLLVVANGLLILAYGLGTISHVHCVTHRQMAAGITEALSRLLHGGARHGL